MARTQKKAEEKQSESEHSQELEEHSFNSEDERQENLRLENYLNQISATNFKNFLNTSLKLKQEGDFEEASLILKALIMKGSEIHNSEMNINLYEVYYHLGDTILVEIESRPEDFFGDGIEKKKKELGDKIGNEDFAIEMMKQIMEKYTNEMVENMENFSEHEKMEQMMSGEGLEEGECSKEQIDHSATKLTNKNTLKNGEKIEDKENNQSEEDEENAEENAESEGNDKNEENFDFDDQNQRQLNEDEIEELQVAWENIETSRAILEKYLDEQKNLSKTDSNHFLQKLAQCYLRLGDIENRKENFKEGIIEYKNSLEVLKKFENEKTSRRMAEVYFLLGNSYIYEFEEKALENALDVYTKGKDIINILFEEEKSKSKGNKKKGILKELKDLLDIFSGKILEVEEEIGMTDNIESSRIKEMFQKDKVNEFPKSSFDNNVEIKKLGKFSTLKKAEGSKLEEGSTKKINK